MHKQVSGRTVNFGPNSPVYPFLELNSGIPPPPFRKTSDLGRPKFTPEYHPPPISENFRFGKTKVYSGIPPPPFWKTSDLGRPKFTPEYPPPPISENFRFGMTKVYSGILPPPPFRKTSDLGRPKFTPEYPSPPPENFRIPRVTTCGDFIQPG